MTEDRARELIHERAANHIFIRMPGVPMLGRCIRVTFGAGEERQMFGERFEAARETVSR